ncbi:MAG TPA: heme-binding protein [Myxococcales bacterium LLY-WYZ-16_1]|nr:heme-binding protein [Myxococcales bacterium LLY-WYZ-16_1]
MMRTLLVVGAVVVVALAAFALWFGSIRNVQTPSYTVLQKSGAFELRGYPEMVVAEVERDGDRAQAVRRGFSPLARYIFAEDRRGEKIAMTAPVTQQRVNDPNANARWQVRFVMPAQYEQGELPEPTSEDVRLRSVAARKMAAIRFNGSPTDSLMEEKRAELLEWMNDNDLEPVGPPIHAYYDPPFMPGFLRRNEVLFEASADGSDSAVSSASGPFRQRIGRVPR